MQSTCIMHHPGCRAFGIRTLRAASHTPEVELARESAGRVTGRATRPRTDEVRIARMRGPMMLRRTEGKFLTIP